MDTYSYSREHAKRTIKAWRDYVQTDMLIRKNNVIESFITAENAKLDNSGEILNCYISGDTSIGKDSVLLDSVVDPTGKLSIGKNSLVVGCKISGETKIGDNCLMFRNLYSSSVLEVGDGATSILSEFVGSTHLRLGAGALIGFGGIRAEVTAHKMNVGSGLVIFGTQLSIEAVVANIGKNITVGHLPVSLENLDILRMPNEALKHKKLNSADNWRLQGTNVNIGDGVRLLGPSRVEATGSISLSSGSHIASPSMVCVKFTNLNLGAGSRLTLKARFTPLNYSRISLQARTGAQATMTALDPYEAQRGDLVVVPAFSRFSM